MSKKHALLIRIDSMVMQKFGYIAQYHGRSKNKEIEVMMRSVIDSFEYKTARSSRLISLHLPKTPKTPDRKLFCTHHQDIRQ